MRRNLQVVVFTLSLTVSGAFAGTSGQGAKSSVEAEIRALNDQAAQMQVSHDVAMASRLLADEYVFIQADGEVTNKAQNVAVIGLVDFVCESFTTSNIEVRVYGETAIVTGLASMTATYKGQDVGGKFRYTDVWVKRRGTWQNVTSQATLLPKSAR